MGSLRNVSPSTVSVLTVRRQLNASRVTAYSKAALLLAHWTGIPTPCQKAMSTIQITGMGSYRLPQRSRLDLALKPLAVACASVSSTSLGNSLPCGFQQRSGKTNTCVCNHDSPPRLPQRLCSTESPPTRVQFSSLHRSVCRISQTGPWRTA